MQDIKNKLLYVIRLAGANIQDNQIEIVDRGVPHKSSTLPVGKMAVYSFLYGENFLKIGKAGPNSNARFNSQHYDPRNSQSNLAKSILNDTEFQEFNLNDSNIKHWIKENTRRIDFLIDASLGMFVLNIIEAFLHLQFKPKYEGYENQRIKKE